MSDVTELVERYLDSWNETDPVRRRALIDKIWAEDGGYTDPLVAVKGRAGIDATVDAVQQRFPGWEFRLAGGVDTHHNLARFSWELGPAGGEAPVVGFDVAVLDGDGRLRAVHGFLDRVPAA